MAVFLVSWPNRSHQGRPKDGGWVFMGWFRGLHRWPWSFWAPYKWWWVVQYTDIREMARICLLKRENYRLVEIWNFYFGQNQSFNHLLRMVSWNPKKTTCGLRFFGDEGHREGHHSRKQYDGFIGILTNGFAIIPTKLGSCPSPNIP